MRFRLLLAVFFSFFAAPVMAAEAGQETQKAIFAGGCFWCMESEFEGTSGVISVVSGYTGGTVENPTYRQVSSGSTGHAEAIEVTYDPGKVTYQQLLDIFWSNIDPTDGGGQFADRGTQYRTEIFYMDEAQHKLAQASKIAKAAKLNTAIATTITQAGVFYPAEAHHQDYSKNNPLQYNTYKYGSGRVSRLKELNK